MNVQPKLNQLQPYVEGDENGITAVRWQPTSAPQHTAGQTVLERYLAGEQVDFNQLPLTPQGTPFQQRVWQALCEIPYGETVTYGDIAKQLGSGPRAVGGAVGANPIPILIPCHRVMGAQGAMTGYSGAGGLSTKQQLLELEDVTLA